MVETSGSSGSDGQPNEAALAGRARLVLLWERLWPALAPPLGIAALFLAATWFGLFGRLPFPGRLAAIAVFAVIFLVSLRGLFRLRLPTQGEIVSRLDAAAGLPHRPVSALRDSLAQGGEDAVSKALWAAHRRSVLARIGRLRIGLPRPGLPAKDRYALRALPVLALFVAYFYAAGSHLPRLTGLFQQPAEIPVVVPVRVDAWITPPLYTRRPPQTLALASDKQEAVPQGSQLVVRVAGDPTATITAQTATGPVEPVAPPVKPGTEPKDAKPAPAAPAPASAAVIEARYVVAADTIVTVARTGADPVKLRLGVIPDMPPTIAFAGPTKVAARGAMTLNYRIEDDYGAVSAEALIALAPAAGARPLYEVPKLPLVASSSRNRTGGITATRDLSEHPFAGAAVKMTLVARDDSGNEGRSPPRDEVIGARTFGNPLARALVEQRRRLALDAGQASMVELALSALLIDPQTYTPKAGTYLTLSAVHRRLQRAEDDPALRAVVEDLWAIALQLEDGGSSRSAQDLKAAQERLREALERGASPEEIARLTQELRQAMQQFLRDYQQAMRQNNTPMDPSQLGDMRTVTPDQLQQMLDRLAELNRNGDREAAERLLSELNDILDNLQPPGQGNPSDSAEMRQMEQQLGDLGKIIRRQQRLRDQTFRQEQGDGNGGREEENGGGERRDRAERGGGGQNDLQGEQGDIRRNLEELRKKMDELGMGSEGDLEGAEQAMRDAERQLGQGDREGAGESQARALERLRKGAQGLARQLAQGRQGQPGGMPMRRGQGMPMPGLDPLGRPVRQREYTDDGTTKVPEAGALERAGRVMEELRRRFADPDRPRPELNYLERLLRP